MTATDPYVFDVGFEDGVVREWCLTDDGAVATAVDTYTPSIFASASECVLESLREYLASDPKVCDLAFESWATSLHEAHANESQQVLRISLERIDEVRTLAREIRGVYERETHAPGTIRLFDVDLTPGFRYCLDRGLDPTPTPPGPDRELRTLSIEIAEPALANRDVSALTIDGETVRGEPADVLWSLGRRLERTDPDVLVLSHADLVPLLSETAREVGLEGFHLGRRPGWIRLASENTYESYGQVGHSPARYRVPGRALIDTSNSFLWHQSGLEGILYMVWRTGRPLQEAAWGSIGTLLTARQIRLAREWGVLAPWNKWEPERFKDVPTLHAADRGGFTFAPDVGLHENVHEIDFASLYPRIICEENISPETVDCACSGRASRGGVHGSSERDRGGATGSSEPDRVPGLGYEICSQMGFLPEVLGPLLNDRAGIKRQLAALSAAGDDDGDNEKKDWSGGGDRSSDDGSDNDESENGGNDDNDDIDGVRSTDASRDVTTDVDRDASVLRARSGAIKWVLVSCFGYQGYRNAKFGRIECHEAINAYAREIALDAKARLEEGGWRVVHGIVDSLWVTPRVDEPEPIDAVIADISARVGIPLEHDGTYEWVCFVPRRESIAARSAATRAGIGASAGADTGAGIGASAGTSTSDPGTSGTGRNASGNDDGSRDRNGGRGSDNANANTSANTSANTDPRGGPAGALTKYFGKRENGTYKFRGIEARQRSTPAFVTDCQREFIETLDRDRDPEAVCDALARRVAELRRGAVDPADLVITKRVSKRLADYRQRTQTVAALRRYERFGIERHPGQSVQYLVAADDAHGPERVRLAFEVDGDGEEGDEETRISSGDGNIVRDDEPTEPTADATVEYDPAYYTDLLVRAAESVVSPLGWDRTRIRRYLRDDRTVTLSAFRT